MRAPDEPLGHAFADYRGIASGRPVGEDTWRCRPYHRGETGYQQQSFATHVDLLGRPEMSNSKSRAGAQPAPPYQKCIFIANCQMRGSPADVIWPKVPELTAVVRPP